MSKWSDRLRNGWNAFRANEVNPKDQTSYDKDVMVYGSANRPDRKRYRVTNAKTIVAAIYNRIALDCSQIDIRHVRLDRNGRFASYIDSGLDNCLTLSANLDQTGRQLIQDIVQSCIDEGVVAVVPVDTDVNINDTDSYDIRTMRVGKILEWYPASVKVSLYDERKGVHKELVVPKLDTAIIENPFYAVMNEKGSTLQRLLRKLALLDLIDEQNSSGKLDMIIQLPFAVRNEAQREQAARRRKDVEVQLVGSKYGIAYIDATEKITQLNRSVDNQLVSQVDNLTKTLYSQLGMTEEILNGTADEQAMLNYLKRTIGVYVEAICLEFKRKFLTKTARSQGQSIEYFSDPFSLVPVNNIADIADKFTRNAILSSNEVRGIIGFKPVDNPEADELRNKNLNKSDAELQGLDHAPNTMDEIPDDGYYYQ